MGFTTWCVDREYDPQEAAEWDDLLAEYLYSHPKMKRAVFGQAVAGVEFFFPRLRGQLKWAHACVVGWDAGRTIRHTVPLGKGLAKLLAVHMCAWGESRVSLGLLLQVHTGMRPGEMLKLRSEHLLFPEEEGHSLRERPLRVALGVKTGTKVKREQYVILDRSELKLAYALCALKRATPAGLMLFPISYSRYRFLIQTAEAVLGLQAHFTPHSPRAGWASDCAAEGVLFSEIKARGRWVSDSSLRTYLDVIGASSISVAAQAAGLAPAIAHVRNEWPKYVVLDDLLAHYGCPVGSR